MKQLLTMLILIAAAAVHGAAQDEKFDARGERKAMLEETAAARKAKKNADETPSVAAPTGVGDPETFGRNVKFLGQTFNGAVHVYRSCDPAVLLADLGVELFPGDVCVVHQIPGPTTNATFDDLGSITLPGRAADNAIYYILNNSIYNELRNEIAGPLFSSFYYAPRLTVESAALNDPAAVNPTTGLPLNGRVTFAVGADKGFSKTLPVGFEETEFGNDSRAASRSISRSFWAGLGLPPRVVDNIYRQPMTIRFGLRVQVHGVFFGQYFYSAQLMGN